MVLLSTKKINTVLEDRSRLTLVFHKGTGAENKIIRRVPFFENPIIQESQRANYVKYQPLGRAGSMYTYTGAESRSFKVNFNLTHPHIESMMGAEYYKAFGSGASLSKEQKKAAFFHEGSYMFDVVDGNSGDNSYAPAYGANHYDAVYKKLTGLWGGTQENHEYMDLYGNFAISPERDIKGLDLINYWVNLLRSTVLNDATNTLNGPPIVRLTHGVLYRNLPCICTDVNISHNELAGYDNMTLLPRVIVISLSLEEVRMGNLGTFKITGLDSSKHTRDNLAGWESVVESPHSLDPQEDVYFHNVFSKAMATSELEAKAGESAVTASQNIMNNLFGSNFG